MTMQTESRTVDMWADVADAYRKQGHPWPGRKNADPKLLIEALVATEDNYELAGSRNQQKQAARLELKKLRRVLECEVYP